jgi:preprotein translocase subunit SecA
MTEIKRTQPKGLANDEGGGCTDTTCCPPQQPVVRTDAKVGRNDPCPCGSGRKHKKCCA